MSQYILIDLYRPNVTISIPELGWFIKMIGMYKFWDEHGQEVAFTNILRNPPNVIKNNYYMSTGRFKNLFDLK